MEVFLLLRESLRNDGEVVWVQYGIVLSMGKESSDKLLVYRTSIFSLCRFFFVFLQSQINVY